MNGILKTSTACLLLSLFAAACGETDAYSPANGVDELESTSVDDFELLPEPALRRVTAPQLNSDQTRRKLEVERFLARHYESYRIVETTQTYSGDVIDWIDPSTVPGSDAEPPPRPSEEDLALPEGVELQRTELDLHPELRGPAGTIPMIRPTFDNYVLEATEEESIEEYIKTRVTPGQPNGQNRLYAGFVKVAANTHMSSFVNDFGGSIEPGTFSIVEMATICRGANPNRDMELVGAAVGRDRVVFGDSVPRIRVEFMSAGSTQQDWVGGWDGVVKGFVPAAGRPYGPNATLAVSTVGGVQIESHLNISLFKGDWWVGHNGNWLGYYPGKYFNLINARGCEASWYGEVYDPTPTDWTWTNLGSGQFSSLGYGKATHVRTPFYVDTAGVSRWPDGAVRMYPYDAWCYTTSAMKKGSTNWERYFYLGGPGGDSWGCN